MGSESKYVQVLSKFFYPEYKYAYIKWCTHVQEQVKVFVFVAVDAINIIFFPREKDVTVRGPKSWRRRGHCSGRATLHRASVIDIPETMQIFVLHVSKSLKNLVEAETLMSYTCVAMVVFSVVIFPFTAMTRGRRNSPQGAPMAFPT